MQRNKFRPKQWTEARGYLRRNADGSAEWVIAKAHAPTQAELTADKKRADRGRIRIDPAQPGRHFRA
jgi:predicted transcriptional regulator of viral defense system